MPEVGITRELSVGEVTQIQHRRNVIIITILAVIFISAFFFSLRDLSPTFTVGVIFLLGFFLLSFINIRIGFVLVILAFLLSPELNFPMSMFRDFTVRTEDLLIIILVLAWLGRLAMGMYKHFLIHTPLNMPIFLIIVWNTLSSWRAIISGMVETNLCILTNLKVIEFFVIFFLIVNNLNDIKEVKFVFYVLLIMALLVGVYAAVQIPKTEVFTENRLSAPFEGKPEPNTLGAYLAISFGLALSIFLYAKRSKLKKLCLALILILPLPIMFSYSRSAYYACLVMIFVLAIISKKRWLLLSLTIFLILSPFILPHSVINRFLYNFQDPRYFGFLDQSYGERYYAFRKAWGYVKSYPILGGGVGGQILDSQYARVMIETSLIGLGLFIWLIIRLIKMGMRLFKSLEDGWLKGVGLGFVVIVTGLIIHGFGNVTFYIVRICEPFWALAGLVAFSLYYINTQKEKPVIPD